MTLHLVYEKEWVPSTRIRLSQLAPALSDRGWPSRVIARPRDAAERSAFEAALGDGDVVLVHRVRPGIAEARWWRSLPVPLVYDFDDAIMFGRRTGPAGWIVRRRRGAGFRRMLACCRGVAAGNAFLAAQCEGFRGPVRVVPSAVDADVPQAGERGPGALCVGWVGRAGNLRYLTRIGPALAAAAARRPLVLVVVSDASVEIPGVRVESVRWTLEGEAAAVARFHVGIMPLDGDGPWVRGKCAYKLLQTMAAGVPAIGSAVGMNAELIRHGENGLLANDLADWERLLVEMADDPQRAGDLGRAGRETVLAGYTVPAVADRLAALLAEVADVAVAPGSPSSSDSVPSTADARS